MGNERFLQTHTQVHVQLCKGRAKKCRTIKADWLPHLATSNFDDPPKTRLPIAARSKNDLPIGKGAAARSAPVACCFGEVTELAAREAPRWGVPVRRWGELNEEGLGAGTAPLVGILREPGRGRGTGLGVGFVQDPLASCQRPEEFLTTAYKDVVV